MGLFSNTPKLFIKIYYYGSSEVLQISKNETIAAIAKRYNIAPAEVEDTKRAKARTPLEEPMLLNAMTVIEKFQNASNFETSLSYVQSRIFADVFPTSVKNEPIDHISILETI